MKVQIPASVDEAVDKLGSLGKLLTAKEWERAAILAAFVEVRETTGRPAETRGTPRFENPRQFAKRGIVGLRDDKTVARYVKAWMNEVGVRPVSGTEVTLPTTPFPSDSYTGSDTGKGSQVEAVVKSNAPAVAKALADSAVVARVIDKMTPEAKQALAADLAEDDYLTVSRALESSSVSVEIERDLTRSRKAKEARDDDWCDTREPLDARALATLAFDVVPVIERLIERIKDRGLDLDAGRHALAYADKISGLMDVLRAQVSGDLEPMDADEFARQVQSILDGAL